MGTVEASVFSKCVPCDFAHLVVLDYPVMQTGRFPEFSVF
jgi:hypothetical protein